MRAGLRLQLLVVSSLLLAIPFLGLRSAREIEAFLVETQEQGLVSTARAIAMALNERPGIFLEDTGATPRGDPGEMVVRIDPLAPPMRADGVLDDWSQQASEAATLVFLPVPAPSPLPVPMSPSGASEPASPTGPADGSSPVPTASAASSAPLGARGHIGRYDRSVFVVVDVDDQAVVASPAENTRVDIADFVELSFVTADDDFVRFAIGRSSDGSTFVATVRPDGSLIPDTRIEAALVDRENGGGYRVEARVPRTLVGARIGLAVNDVDDAETRVVRERVAIAQTADRSLLAPTVASSPELAALARGLGRAHSRLWILDARGRVLAHAGTLQAGRTPQPPPTWRQNVVNFLRPLYGSILIEPTEDFRDVGPGASRLESAEITRALEGFGARGRRRTTDGRAVVLSAAEPVWSEGRVVGAALAEETTNETLAARNRAFERLFFSMAGAVLFGAATLLIFASRLSFRIRGLRDAVERAIDARGRVHGRIPHVAAADEVGDLSRSFASLLERQKQYTAHLEELRSRLSHEIRTPVAVVRSSLDNLRLQGVPQAASIYLERADEGLSRLVTILQRMTEASRLEQSLATTPRETFDLSAVVTGCVGGHRLANPSRVIELAIDDAVRSLKINGAPDLVAQMMDKLVDNALDFATPGTAIEIRLNRGIGAALLSVSNEGPPLPAGMSASVFDSMVSSRPHDAAGGVHLGLGLAIVKVIADFHGATVTATNRKDPSGVTFLIAFPIDG